MTGGSFDLVSCSILAACVVGVLAYRLLFGRKK